MNLEKGVRSVTCRECGAKGEIRIGRQLASGKQKFEARVPHLETCSLFVRPQPMHLKQKRWRKQEKRANELVGARATLASGAVNLDGDGRVFGEWRVECKQTKKSSFRLTQKVWSKLVKGAEKAGEKPMLHIEFHDRTPALRKVVVKHDYIPESPEWRLIWLNPKLSEVIESITGRRVLHLDPAAWLMDEADFKDVSASL